VSRGFLFLASFSKMVAQKWFMPIEEEDIVDMNNGS
jgi:hypothetical protein